MANDTSLSTTAASRYAKLESDRRPFLDRARQCAALTVPALMPPAGFSASSELPTPYQSLGARGVRTLASKLLLSLYPGIPFFNYRVDDIELEKMGTARGEFDKALASRERAVVTELDLCVFRPAAFQALLQLIVCGNGLLYVPQTQGERAQSYRLDQYVVRRDNAGNLLEIIIKETLDYASLPEAVQAQVAKAAAEASSGDPADRLDDRPVDLFTHVYLDGGQWCSYQEAFGVALAGTDGKYKDGELPWLVLRFSAQPGESYGRSYTEEYLGDLDSLEALSELLVEGSVASGRVLFLVDPAGTTSIETVAKAKNGAVRSGRAADVTAMQVQKANDLSVAKSHADEISTRLSYAFLLHSSIQRAGERVTAEEIRFMASELDDGLGGVYTLLAADLQLPSVRLFEKRMEKRLGAPKLPSETVVPVIVSGLEAIGRGHDQRNLKAFVAEILQVLGPEQAMRYLKPLELISRSAAAYNIDTNNLLPTEEEVAQREQQAMLAQLASHMGPNAITQLGAAGKEVLKGAMTAPGGMAP